MIKSETIMSKGKASTQVTVEGSRKEILADFMGILDTLEEECPDVVILAFKKRMEKYYED